MNRINSRGSNWFFKTFLGSVFGVLAVSAQPNVYVANVAGNTVSVVSGSSLSVVASIPVALGPTGVAVTPNGAYVYVACQSENVVAVIDASTNSVIANIPVGATPKQIAMSPDGARLLVADSASNQVSIIDTASNSVIATVGVGVKPGGMAFSPDSTRAFVANAYSSNVSIINTSSNTVVGTFNVPGGPSAIAVTPNGQRVYVANGGVGVVTVHDMLGNLVTTINGFVYPNSLAVTPSGTRVFVSNGNADSASVIDTSSNTVIANIALGNLPTAVAISLDGTQAFVTNEYGFSLSVIDTASNAVKTTIQRVGVYPVGVATIPAAPQISTGCTYSINPGGVSLPQGGGNGSVTVTAPPNCLWTANSNSGWLTITGGANGSGNGTVFYSASANATAAALSGSLTIAGQSFIVSEAAISCSYSLSANSTVMPSLGGASSVAAIAPAGCAWTVSSDSSWLTIKSGLSGIGTGVISFVTAVNTGASRSGNLHVGGLTFNISQAGATVTALPTADSVTPNAGSATSQNVTFKYSSVNGYGYLENGYLLINSSVIGANSCWAYYSPSSNLIYLYNDAGSAVTPMTPGSAGVLSNSQCIISGPGSAVIGSGNTLSLTLAISIKPSFAGTHKLFGYAVDKGGLESGWQHLGTWTTGTTQPPTADSVTPNVVSGTSQNATFKYSSANGFGYLTVASLLINSGLSGYGACFVYYSPSNNGIYLYNDLGSGVAGPLSPGSAGTLSNSQCTINGTGSAATGAGNTLSLTLAITLKPSVLGTQNLYGYAGDSAGHVSGWQQLGTWTPQ
ncbi:MAG: beta-propeller fold lactonase family protein [Acidobacteriota bacterium]|nr:beta-propeller fold lactonase family protein [Acidobacteriota bacterium]